MIDPTLESHYNVRAAVPEHPAIFATWRARSEDYRARAEARLDLSYGPSPAETLDLFPASEPGAPLHMFIHGGYWQALDKSDFSFIAEPLVAAGVTVAVVNYALCPSVTLDDIVGQVRRAAAWLYGNAREVGGDPRRLQVSGHSAGGHLTAMLMATDWAKVSPALPRNLVHSGVAVSGLFDLEPLRATTINDKVGMDAATAQRNSPLFMAPATTAPLVLAVGALEGPGFMSQSDRLAETWGQRGVPVERIDLPGCHHLAAVERLAAPGDALLEATLRLIGR